MNGRGETNKEQERKPENMIENPKNGANETSSYPKTQDAAGDVNMEATITADDVVRAGGFGARDDIGSFLPVAADSTDFEASLLYAREFEEPQVEKRRPGLGWTEPV